MVAALAAARLPLGVVQAAALIDMFGENQERTESLTDAFALTFGGDYRCAVCEVVGEEVGAKAEGAPASSTENTFVKTPLLSAGADPIVVESPRVVGRFHPEAAAPRDGFFENALPPPRAS